MVRSLRVCVLSIAHDGHLGIVNGKQRCKGLLWWPGIDLQQHPNKQQDSGEEVTSVTCVDETLMWQRGRRRKRSSTCKWARKCCDDSDRILIVWFAVFSSHSYIISTFQSCLFLLFKWSPFLTPYNFSFTSFLDLWHFPIRSMNNGFESRLFGLFWTQHLTPNGSIHSETPRGDMWTSLFTLWFKHWSKPFISGRPLFYWMLQRILAKHWVNYNCLRSFSSNKRK